MLARTRVGRDALYAKQTTSLAVLAVRTYIPHAEIKLKQRAAHRRQIGHEEGSFSVYRTERTADEAEDNDENSENDPFYNPEDAFGRITLCCSNPLPRKSALIGRSQVPSEQVSTSFVSVSVCSV